MLMSAKPGLLHSGDTLKYGTAIWGYNGTAPGPLLRIQQGKELFVRLHNGLPQPTAIHWRGIRGPNAMDGVAGLTQEAVAAGAAFDYRFSPPDSGTFIYHAHPADHLGEQYMRGLSGMLIVDEVLPPDVDADVPLVISDWLHGPDGKLAEPVFDPGLAAGPGRIGNLVLVNGRPAPGRQVMRPGTRLRMRIANLSPARLIALAFSGAAPTVIFIDGQPCESFQPDRNILPAGPGARLDVILDLPREAGKSLSITMLSWPLPDRKTPPSQALYAFVTGGKPVKPRDPVKSLPPNPLLPETIRLQDAQRLDLVLAASETKQAAAGQFWAINGRSARQARETPLLSVRRGQPVSLGFINRTPFPEVLRVHGHSFRLLHLLDDGWEPYWLDSVIIPPGKTSRIAFLADNPGKWRIGSGILEHAESGLAGWFKVD